MIKKPKVFLPTLIAFAIIGVMNSCQGYHLNHNEPTVKEIEIKAEEIDFDEIFAPVDEINIDKIVEESHQKTK